MAAREKEGQAMPAKGGLKREMKDIT